MAKQNYKNIDRGVFFHTHFATESLLCVERRQVNALKSNVIRLRAPSAIRKNGLILRNILMQKVYVCVLLNKSTKTLCDYHGRRTLPQKEEMSSKKNQENVESYRACTLSFWSQRLSALRFLLVLLGSSLADG